ncbi:TetR/AcrR family transcriptional regulator [Streptomyces alanosinicus]|uniref:TetR family transcriptional regulator n=1 Tax=Streptomyces alanosinicus TaxID=68171 RepID=A0A918YED2_9ACTN|nr:TetR/AcrR family transcriptional regulator [Streptomyces alanosinicus]GHE01103.1 TetR family transcriptional regulator [Streptomyces alanosinicus]
MMKQERASRTRQALLTAAAGEFDRRGYAGASLARIARAAQISTGALTFHFASKEALSTAVREQGNAATQALVARTTARREPPVQCVVSLTLGLVELLETDASVRAAARLEREAADARHSWRGVWAPLIRERLRATTDAELCPGTDTTALTALAEHLVCGMEATLAHRGRPDSDRGNSALLARIWHQVLHRSAPLGCDGGRR